MKTLNVLLIISLLLVGTAIIVPSFMKSRETSCQNSCINNLRQIEAGKEQWALENAMETGHPVVVSEVNAYIKGGEPICPAGARYTYNAVGMNATCDSTNAWHVLP
jgi:competence protein ComGC